MNKDNLKNINDISELFELWQEAQINESEDSLRLTKYKGLSSEIEKDFFVVDGIIDIDVYNKQKRKVLFISNEANIAKHESPIKNRIIDFKEYYETGKDEWDGKMRERICALYKVISGIDIDRIPDNKVAKSFAFMNINKRGGGEKIDSHVDEYCKVYKDFIVREIELISPDYVVWLGAKTYDNRLPFKYLGAIKKDGKGYFEINGKQIPLIRMWHTSYYRGKNDPLPGYKNKIIGKLCAKLRQEMKYYGL